MGEVPSKQRPVSLGPAAAPSSQVAPSHDDLADSEAFMREIHDMYPAGQLDAFMTEYDRLGMELDRIRRVRCLGHVYSGLQPPEQCGDYAGHEGKCQP